MDRIIETTLGPVPVRDSGGTGPVVLFVHGLLVDADLWRDVVADLGSDVRTVVPQLPLGAHAVPADPRTVRSLPGIADLLGALLEALELTDVTVVGNDSGGATSQLLVSRHPERVHGLVLTSCELYDNVPPRLLAPLFWAFQSDRVARLLLRAWQTAPGRRSLMALVTRRRVDDVIVKRWLAASHVSDGVRADLREVVAATPRDVLSGIPAALRAWGGPVSLVWGGGDRLVFPAGYARRFVAEVPAATLTMVPRARAFVPLDAPEEVAAAVRDVVERAALSPRRR